MRAWSRTWAALSLSALFAAANAILTLARTRAISGASMSLMALVRSSTLSRNSSIAALPWRLTLRTWVVSKWASMKSLLQLLRLSDSAPEAHQETDDGADQENDEQNFRDA